MINSLRMKVTLANCLDHIIKRPAPKILAITTVHIMAKVIWSLSVSMAGPGVIPWMRNAPSKIAIVALPGIPKAIVGISEAPFIALLALSGAITPRTSPFPNSSRSLELCTACPYATQSTIEAPSPGKMPIYIPMALHLMTSHQFSIASLMP